MYMNEIQYNQILGYVCFMSLDTISFFIVPLPATGY